MSDSKKRYMHVALGGVSSAEYAELIEMERKNRRSNNRWIGLLQVTNVSGSGDNMEIDMVIEITDNVDSPGNWTMREELDQILDALHIFPRREK